MQEVPLIFIEKPVTFMSMSTKIKDQFVRIAVIGCGDWGRNIALTLHRLGSLYALGDQNLSSSKAIQCSKDTNVDLVPLDQILNDEKIQGVCIATPPHTHFDIAKEALEAGKNVFVEKPLVLSIAEGKALETLAKEKGLILMVGHLLRYHKAFQILEEWVKGGKLGSILHINTSRKNLGKIYPHDDVIWDLAPHDLSMILALIPHPVESVLATGANYAVPRLADEALISLKFENSSQQAFISLSRLSPFKEQKVTVVGTKGMAVLDDTLPQDRKLTFFNSHVIQESPDHFSIHQDRVGVPELYEAQNPLDAEMTHFIDCIQHGKAPRTPAQEAIQILSIINAAQQSIKAGQWAFCFCY